MEDDPGGEPPLKAFRTGKRVIAGTKLAVGALLVLILSAAASFHPSVTPVDTATLPIPWNQILTLKILVLSAMLGSMSAFFSASEVAFLSLNKVELRTMTESSSWILRLISSMLKRPGNLLTTILMGNTIVNVFLSIVLAEPIARVCRDSFLLSSSNSYFIAVALTTSLLLFFCEILPKVFAAMQPKAFAIFAVIPMYLVYKLLALPQYTVMRLVALLFKLTHLSQVQPAPFLTDEEFITLLSDGEASGIIEEEERHMIEGILEFDDVTLKEILVPRPDIIAVKENITAQEALAIIREYEFSRMPVYKDDLDHITGILYAKDLLPLLERDTLDQPISAYRRPPHFVPETMSVGDFVKMSQRLHIHIAIVVDEYGGTEGLVTLQDALRKVVGDIGEEDDVEEPEFLEISPGTWQIAGNYPLEEFEKQVGIQSGDENHTTVGGFLMALSDKIPEPGDEIEFGGLHFNIVQVDKKRVTRVLVKDLRQNLMKGEGIPVA